MGKSLIITEKPSVAQEFAKVLHVSGRKDGCIENQQYVITWCVGHLVEMVYPEAYDEKYKKWKLEDLPFLPNQYKYGVIGNVKKQYDIVHGLLFREDIDRVYWAGDAGKEGQVIEENIRMYGGVREGMEELRVWIDSQTEEEIMRGIQQAKPMDAYANLGRSGIMRSIEDYAMGINFSRVMSVKYGNLLNDAAGTKSYTAIAVGRVMTCVLGMVVIREREIRNFDETPFYRIIGRFTDDGIEGEWKAIEGSRYFESPLLYKENGFRKEESARELMQELDGIHAVVKSVDNGLSRKKAPLLFNLAELQAECAKRFKISPDETLQIAQDLYEKKLTTYPRTDARVLSTAVAKEIGKNIGRLKGYTPIQQYAETIMSKGLYRNIAKTAYTDDSKVTDHYAIIPTGQLTELSSLNELQRKVFDMIARRFLSIFYPPAVYETVKLTVSVDTESFYSSAKVLKEPGFLEVAGRIQSDEDKEKEQNGRKLLQLSQSLTQGSEIKVLDYQIKEGKTSPPKRYTSGSMVLAMENAGQLIEDEELRAQIKGSGIGTSATRAEIIKKLVRIGYLNLNKKTQVLTPENLGEMVFEVVNMTTPALLNPKMTASWEKGLDGITQGTVEFASYREKLEDYIRKETNAMIQSNLAEPLTKRIRPLAGKNARGVAARKKLGVACPICGGDIETTPFGYGCSNYKKDGTGCKFSIGTIAGKDLTEEEVQSLIRDGRTPTIRGFKSKAGKKFDACIMQKRDEENKLHLVFDFENVEAIVIPDVVCKQCGGKIIKTGFGYMCENHKRDQENSCNFSIGTIAGKDLSESQIVELLTKERTETIRGFKSKSGKKFDACLTMVKDENGQFSVVFDFEHTQAKKVKDVKCPLCGGDIVQTPFGYGCAGYVKDDPESCRFSIGKMSGKLLTEAQVRELLTEGKTSTIYGFKSKAGKKFDARIALAKDEKNTVTGLRFDFDDLQAKKVKDVKCPLCGGDIVQTPFGYGCANYQKDNADSCRFSIGKIAGVQLKEAQVKELLKDGKTKEIEGFVAKTGMMFSAALKVTPEGQVTFDFPEKPKPVETTLKCPKCKKMMLKSQWYYECDCGYRISHTIAKVELSEDIMREILEHGETKEVVTGFVSKSGNTFECALKYEDDRILFDFDRTKSIQASTQKEGQATPNSETTSPQDQTKQSQNNTDDPIVQEDSLDSYYESLAGNIIEQQQEDELEYQAIENIEE